MSLDLIKPNTENDLYMRMSVNSRNMSLKASNITCVQYCPYCFTLQVCIPWVYGYAPFCFRVWLGCVYGKRHKLDVTKSQVKTELNF